MTAVIGGSKEFAAGVIILLRGEKMVPIFMLKDAESRFVKGDNGLREFMRTEYGNPDSAWVVAEERRIDRRDKGARNTSRLRARSSRTPIDGPPKGEKAHA